MFRPVLDRKFGVTGELACSSSGTEQVITYWYHSPYFWRIERNGNIELIAGHDYQAGRADPEIERFRMLTMPMVLAGRFGLNLADGKPVPAAHGRTGRSAMRAALDQRPGGSLVFDVATHMVLSLNDGNGLNIDTSEFQVLDSMEASIFGEETLETPGFYYGYIEGNTDGKFL